MSADVDLQSLPLEEVEQRLECSADGLSQAEAEKRLARYGPNEIAETKVNPLLKFLTYLWGPIPWMIEIAVILSGVAGHWADFFIILVLLVANAVVGFWEERQAGNAIDALKANLAIKARVRRDGNLDHPRGANCCRVTSSACGLATSCRPMPACSMVTPPRQGRDHGAGQLEPQLIEGDLRVLRPKVTAFVRISTPRPQTRAHDNTLDCGGSLSADRSVR